MGRMFVRTPSMDTRVPPDEVWIRSDVPMNPGQDPEKIAETMIRKNPADACDGCAFFSAGRYGLGKCGFHGDLRTIDDTCPSFKPRMRAAMILVNPSGDTAKCMHCGGRIEYDPVSFTWKHKGRTSTYAGKRYAAGEPHSHRAIPKGNPPQLVRTSGGTIGTIIETQGGPTGGRRRYLLETSDGRRVWVHGRVYPIKSSEDPHTPEQLIPYTSEDYTMDEIERQATELRASEEYSEVIVRRARPEGGRAYGRVYVRRKEKNPSWDDPFEEPPRMKCRICGRELMWDSTKWVHGDPRPGGESHFPDPVGMRNPAGPTTPVKMRTETGEEVTVGVPADWERMAKAWQTMEPIYQELFKGVQNKEHWKDPIGPLHFDDYAPAQLMADAITFFHGGSEVDQAPDGGWIVSSKGYYEYIGG